MRGGVANGLYEALRSVDAECPACGGRPTLETKTSELTMTLHATARCHGQVERGDFAVDDVGDKYGGYLAHRVSGWIRGLFKGDCNPDVMELLRYNQGKS